MPKNPSKARAEGMIRRRGNSFQAILFAGTDPVTGRQLYLRGSSTDEAEAKKILRQFKAQVAEQRHAKTRASLRSAIGSCRSVTGTADTRALLRRAVCIGGTPDTRGEGEQR